MAVTFTSIGLEKSDQEDLRALCKSKDGVLRCYDTAEEFLGEPDKPVDAMVVEWEHLLRGDWLRPFWATQLGRPPIFVLVDESAEPMLQREFRFGEWLDWTYVLNHKLNFPKTDPPLSVSIWDPDQKLNSNTPGYLQEYNLGNLFSYERPSELNGFLDNKSQTYEVMAHLEKPHWRRFLEWERWIRQTTSKGFHPTVVISQAWIDWLQAWQSVMGLETALWDHPMSGDRLRQMWPTISRAIVQFKRVRSAMKEARSYREQGNWKHSQSVLRQSVVNFPQEACLFEALGDALLLNENPESRQEALEAYEGALKLDPGNGPVMEKCFDAYCRLERAPEGLRRFKHYLNRYPWDVERRFHFAEIAHSRRDLGCAKVEASRVLRMSPSHVRAQKLVTSMGGPGLQSLLRAG